MKIIVVSFKIEQGQSVLKVSQRLHILKWVQFLYRVIKYVHSFSKYTLKETEDAIKNGQSRENRRCNQEWTI